MHGGGIRVCKELELALSRHDPACRPPGCPARSKWFFPDGSSEWRDCNVVQASPDGAVYSIRWQQTGEDARRALPRPACEPASASRRLSGAWGSSTLVRAGGIKTVSRFNILFEGETEDLLTSLRKTALVRA